jgi:phage FluMu gp28-like protein
MRSFPGYQRQSIPWWLIGAMCKDVKQAMTEAPFMVTEDRVCQFGTKRLVEIFENMLLDDFQQEYECSWVDENVAWIDWELIKRNQIAAQQDHLVYFRGKSVDEAFAAIDNLAQAVKSARVEMTLVGGMDIGRTHDTTEIILLGKGPTGQLPYRLGITLDRIEFDDQQNVVTYLLNQLPVTLFLIDRTGIGMQFSENMNKLFGDKAQGVHFTSDLKNLWAVEVKLRFQRGEVPIPLDRDLSYQIHSIKRITTASNNSVFDTSSNEKHHADQFWALALAVWAARGEVGSQLETAQDPFAGYRG